MHITVFKGKVAVVADNDKEANELVAFVNNEKKAEKKERGVRGSYKKTCEHYGKTFQGRLGLGVHQSRMHGIQSEFTKKYKNKHVVSGFEPQTNNVM